MRLLVAWGVVPEVQQILVNRLLWVPLRCSEGCQASVQNSTLYPGWLGIHTGP